MIKDVKVIQSISLKRRNPNSFSEDSDNVFDYERSSYPLVSLYVDDAEFNVCIMGLSPSSSSRNL